MAETYKLMCLALIMGLALSSPCVAVDVSLSWADIRAGSLISAQVLDVIHLPTPMILQTADKPCVTADAVTQFKIDAPGDYPFGLICGLAPVLNIHAT